MSLQLIGILIGALVLGLIIIGVIVTKTYHRASKEQAFVRTGAGGQKVVKDGADSIAEVHYPDVVWPYNPTEQETKNLAAGIAEAKKLGVDFQIHAVSDLSMVAAVRMGGKKLNDFVFDQRGVDVQNDKAGLLHEGLYFLFQIPLPRSNSSWRTRRHFSGSRSR